MTKYQAKKENSYKKNSITETLILISQINKNISKTNNIEIST